MNTNKRLLIAVVAVTLTFVAPSCKKNSDGGKAEIHAEIFHGTTEIRSADLYVKFGATSAPSDPTTDYDLKLKGETTDNHVHVEDLHRGDYYLYAVGRDSTTHQTVKGGTHVEIKWSERKKLIDAEVQTNP